MSSIPRQQIAHDLAIAQLTGKQLPPEELVKEYRALYSKIFKYLVDTTPKAVLHNTKKSLS